VTFPALHLSYGLGFLRGLVDFLVFSRDRRRDVTAVPISR
jgi:hypothetical protein